MAVVLHILKRDFRASWIFLCVVFAFLVLQLSPLCHAPSWEYFVRTYGSVFSSLEGLYLIIMVIVVRLIQEDSLVGTSAFWMTRPISRKSLLLAKGLFVFLFLVLVPVAVDFALLFHFGMKSFQVLPFLFTVLAIHLTIICTFVSLAAVTPNWQSCAVLATVALICLFLANNRPAIPDWRYGWITGFTISVLLLFSVTLGVSIHQFLTRKTIRSVALLIAGFALVWLSFQFSIWEASAHHSFRTQSSVDGTLSVNLVPVNKADYFPMNPLNRSISAVLVLQGIAAPEEVVLTHVDSQLDFQNGERISYTRDNSITYGGNIATQALLPGLKSISPFIFNPSFELLSINESKYKELCNRVGTYTGEAQFNVYRDAIVSEVPLIKGAQIRFDPNPIYIANVEFEREIGRLSVFLEYMGLQINTDRDDEFIFCVLNRAHSQMMPCVIYTTSGFIHLMIIPGIDLMHWETNLQYYAPNPSGKPVSILDDAWLADARLVAIHRDYVGRFSRKFEIKNFRMADYPPEYLQKSIGPGK